MYRARRLVKIREIFCLLLKFEFKFYLRPRYSRHPDCISTCESFPSGKRFEHLVKLLTSNWLTSFWMSFSSLRLSRFIFESMIPDEDLFTTGNENRNRKVSRSIIINSTWYILEPSKWFYEKQFYTFIKDYITSEVFFIIWYVAFLISKISGLKSGDNCTYNFCMEREDWILYRRSRVSFDPR